MSGGRVTKNSSKSANTPTTSQPVQKYTLNDIMNELKGVRHSISFISKQYDDLNLKISGILEDNIRIKNDNEQLKINNNYLNNELNAIKEYINDQKQGQLKNNAVIFGIPPLRNLPDVKAHIEKIIEKTNTSNNIDELGIIDIYQKKTAENNTNAPIIIKFQNHNKKSELMQLMKSCRIKTNDIGITTNKTINMMDQLTPHNQKLYNEAKQLRSHGFKFIWFNHGKILARKNENTSIIFISNLDCIDKLKQSSQHANSHEQPQI